MRASARCWSRTAPTLVGILTYTDLLRAFVRVIQTATQERIAVDLEEDR